MQLTNQQIAQMKSRGLDDQTISNLAKQNGYTMPSTQSTLSKVTKGVNSVFAGGKIGEAIGTLGGYAYTKAKDKIKGTNVADYYDLSAPSPKQVVGDSLRGAVQIAGAKLPVAGSILGKTAQFGGLGMASGATKGIADNLKPEEIQKNALREGAVGALTGLTFGIAEKALKGATNFTSKLGGKIQYGVIKPSQADISDGFKIETLKKYNLGGNLQQTSEKTNAKLQELSQQLNQRLKSSNTSLNLNNVFKNTQNRLIGSKLENFGSNAQMEGALEKLRNEIVSVSGTNGLVSVPEAQILKRASGHFGAWNYGNVSPEAKASERMYNTFYNEIKTAIEKASPQGVRDINQQISELIPIMNAVIRRIPVAERNGAISLTDLISLVGATVEPTALSISLANRLSKSGRFGALLSKTQNLGQKTMQGAEQIAQSVISR